MTHAFFRLPRLRHRLPSCAVSLGGTGSHRRTPLSLAVSLALALAFAPVSASAGVFDPLLKVLLPFYKKDDKAKADAPDATQATQEAQATDAAPEPLPAPSAEQGKPVLPPTDDGLPVGVVDGVSDEQGDGDAVDDGKMDGTALIERGLGKSPQPKSHHDDASQMLIIDPVVSLDDALLANLPADILDDTLTAGDTVPVLDEPDLYALMSAEFAADRGQVEQALTLYKAESFKQNATAVFERALALSIEFEDPSDSLAFASAWQSKNPDHIPAWFYVAHLALKAKDYRQAMSTLEMILAYDPTADLSQILTGIAPTAPADQRKLFFALQEIDENNPSLSVMRAGLLLRMGETAPALLHINHALRANPQNLAYILLKVEILKAHQKADELWRFIAAKRAELPHEKELYLYQIRHQIEHGELIDAWALLLQAHEQVHDPEVDLLAALVGLDINQYEQAIAILTPMIDMPGYTSQAHYYLGIAYERTGDVVRARHHYERVSDYEHVLDARTKVVGFYLIDNDVERAMATLVRLRDDYEIYAADSYILQAEILLRQGKRAEALDVLTLANREYPDDDRLLFASFKLLEHDLSDDDKRAAIDKLISMDPNNLEYQLADVRLKLTHSPHDARALATAAAISRMAADDPSYDSVLQLEALVVLATDALALGDYAGVIEYLQVPYDVAPDLNAGILLLRAYQGLGHSDRVNELLADLQYRFAFGQNRTGAEGQSY